MHKISNKLCLFLIFFQIHLSYLMFVNFHSDKFWTNHCPYFLHGITVPAFQSALYCDTPPLLRSDARALLISLLFSFRMYTHASTHAHTGACVCIFFFSSFTLYLRRHSSSFSPDSLSGVYHFFYFLFIFELRFRTKFTYTPTFFLNDS